MNRRFKFFVLCAALAGAFLAWRWVAGWGLITVNFVEAPLGKVLAAVQRQGGVKIVTNVDLGTPVTLQVRSAPVFEALDILAVRLEADMNLLYILAPDRAGIQAGLAAAASPKRPEDWRVTGDGRGGFGLGGSVAPDLRRIALKPSQTDDPSLTAFLAQASAKTGAAMMTPGDWNPTLGTAPKPGRLSSVIRQAASRVHGQFREVAWLRKRPERGEGRAWAARENHQPSGDGAPGAGRPGGERREGGPPRPRMNPEWMAERVEAQIALLPKDEQAEAKKDFEDMRAMWASLRELSPEERRVKIEEMMNNPAVQERIEERMAIRSDKRSPAQRAQRYRNYVERKRAAQQSQQNQQP